MKKILILLTLIIITISCSEEVVLTTPTEITGTWQLTEQLIDPGDGSGEFQNVVSDKTITFLSDGTYTSNGSICTVDIKSEQQTSGTYDSEKLLLTCPNEVYNISYKIEASNLILSFPCIEGCAQKFEKVTTNNADD